MKVLILTIKKGLQGGVEAATADIYMELRRNPKYKLGFFDYGSKSDHEPKILKPFFRLNDLIKLYKKIRIFRPKLIHIDTSFNKMSVLRDAPTIFLIGLFKIRTFLWMHGTNPASVFSSKLFSSLSNFVFSKAGLIGLMSKDEMKFFRQKYPDLKKKLVEVTPGVDIARIRKGAKKLDLGGKMQILFISRLIEDKGPFESIEAYFLAKKKLPTAKLLIAGAGPAEKKLRRFAQGSSIKFLGHVRDDNSLYKSSDMLVLPTYHNEGMPMTIVKALIFGLPLITTKTRGIKDHLKERSNCLFVKPKDINDLAEKMINLAQDDQLRKKMSKNNLRLAKNFDSKLSAEILMRIYQKCQTH